MKYNKFIALTLAISLALTASPVFAQTKIIRRGNTDIKEMALTFDDGNDPIKVRAIVNKLNNHDVDATFFFVGTFIANNKILINEMIADGHEIVNHTFSHKDLVKIDNQSIQNEIENTKYHYNKVTNKKMLPLIRPPYGSFDDRVLEELGKNSDNYLVMWSIDTLDWRGKTPEQINKTVFDEAGNGKIVLMHTNKNVNTDMALDDMIEGLKEKGYALVTISEMISKLPQEAQHPNIILESPPIKEVIYNKPIVTYTPPGLGFYNKVESERFFSKVINIFKTIFE